MRDGGELRGRAALHEEHAIVGRNGEQFAQVRLGALGHGHERLAAMADFHHRHAALPVEQFVARLLEHRQRQDGGSR